MRSVTAEKSPSAREIWEDQLHATLVTLLSASKAIQLQSFCFIVTILFSYNTNNDSVTPFGNIKYRQIKGTKRQIKISNDFLVQK